MLKTGKYSYKMRRELLSLVVTAVRIVVNIKIGSLS